MPDWVKTGQGKEEKEGDSFDGVGKRKRKSTRGFRFSKKEKARDTGALDRNQLSGDYSGRNGAVVAAGVHLECHIYPHLGCAVYRYIGHLCDGLGVYDTYTHFNYFGQGVILMLIQVGGLGFATMATGFSVLLRRKLGLRELLLASESASGDSLDIARLLRVVLSFTFACEMAGFTLR